MAQLAQRLRLDLADALARDLEFLSLIPISLMVDFAAPNISQNSPSVCMRFGVSVSMRVIAPRRSLRLILSMRPALLIRIFHYFRIL